MVGVRSWLTPEEFQRTVGAFQSGTDQIVYSAALSAANKESSGSPLIDELRELAHSPGEVDRREKAKKKQDVFDNAIKRHLEELLQKSFAQGSYEKLSLTLHTSTNLLLGIASDLAKLYESRPARYFKEEPGGPEDEPAEEKPQAVAPGEAEAAAAAAAAGLPPPPPAILTEDEIPADDRDVEEPTEATDPQLEAILARLDLTDEGREDEEEPYAVICRESQLDEVLSKVEKLCAVHECVWLRPNVEPRDPSKVLPGFEGAEEDDAPEAEAAAGDAKAMPEDSNELGAPEIEWTIYTPANATVLVDPHNPCRVRAWCYWAQEHDDKGVRREVIHVYTSTQYQKLGKDWRPMGPLTENPLGMIPVVKFEIDKPINGYFCKGVGDDLLEATLEQCVLKTVQNQRAKDTGFKQLAIQGDADKMSAAQVMGSSAPVMLGDGQTASVLDLEPNLDQWTTMVQSRRDDMRERYGVVSDSKESSGQESGYARKLRWAKVLAENKRRRPFFASSEQHLYCLVACSCQVLAGFTELDPSRVLVVDFAEPEFDESPEKQAAADATDLELGAISILDVLRRKNPDLSDAELARLAWRNKKINDALMGQRTERLVDYLALSQGKPGTPQAQSLTDVEGGTGGAPAAGGPPGAKPPPGAFGRPPPPRGAPPKGPPAGMKPGMKPGGGM